MEAELKAAFDDVEVELIEGSGGIFELRVGSELVFSKDRTGRFPEPGEIVKLIRSSAGK